MNPTHTFSDPNLTLQCSTDEKALVASFPSGRERAIVTAETNPVTGGIDFSAGSSPVSLVEETSLLLRLMNRAVSGALSYDYFVNTATGNDTNDGLTSATAWKSLSKLSAIAIAAGQTKSVLVKAGTYNTALDYVLIQKDGIEGATVNIAFESGCVMDGALANPAASSGINGFEASGNQAWKLVIYGNGLQVNNYHDTSTVSSPNGVGCHGYAQVFAYSVNCVNCDDGFSAHDNTKMYLYDCTASGSEKGAFDHVGSAYVEAWRCTFTGGGSLGIGGSKATGVIQKLYDCTLNPTVADEAFDGSNTTLTNCRIGNSTYRVKLLNDYGGAAALVNCYLNLYQDGNVAASYLRCYGKFSVRSRPGAGVTVDRCVIVGPATGKAAVLIADYAAGGSAAIKFKNNVFKGSYTFDSLTLAAYANEIFAVESEFRNNVLHGGATYSALMTTANTNAGGTKISGTITSDPVIGSAATYSIGDYAIGALFPATDSGYVGFSMANVS